MTTLVTPEIFPFLSETEQYARFVTLSEYCKMSDLCVVSNGEVVKYLNSDDFVIIREAGEDSTRPTCLILYYRTDVPVEFKYITEIDRRREARRKMRLNGNPNISQ